MTKLELLFTFFAGLALGGKGNGNSSPEDSYDGSKNPPVRSRPEASPTLDPIRNYLNQKANPSMESTPSTPPPESIASTPSSASMASIASTPSSASMASIASTPSSASLTTTVLVASTTVLVVSNPSTLATVKKLAESTNSTSSLVVFTSTPLLITTTPSVPSSTVTVTTTTLFTANTPVVYLSAPIATPSALVKEDCDEEEGPTVSTGVIIASPVVYLVSTPTTTVSTTATNIVFSSGSSTVSVPIATPSLSVKEECQETSLLNPGPLSTPAAAAAATIQVVKSFQQQPLSQQGLQSNQQQFQPSSPQQSRPLSPQQQQPQTNQQYQTNQQQQNQQAQSNNSVPSLVNNTTSNDSNETTNQESELVPSTYDSIQTNGLYGNDPTFTSSSQATDTANVPNFAAHSLYKTPWTAGIITIVLSILFYPM